MMFKPYLFVRQNRGKKKWQIYKQLYSLSIDWQVFLYLLLFIGYISFAIIVSGELSAYVESIRTFSIATFSGKQYWFIFLNSLPMLFILRSFQHPGVIFTSAEFLLTLLPNRRFSIWLYSALEQWVKQFLLLMIGFVFLSILSIDLALNLLPFLIGLFFLLVMLTIIQWKLFQFNVLYKIGLLLFYSIINILYGITEHSIFMLLNGLIVIALFILSLRFLFDRIDWSKVTATSDFLIWNMALISRATKVKFQKEKQSALWYRFKGWKKPFHYHIEKVYQRVWYIYFEKQIGVIFKVTGGLFLLLLVASYFKQMYFMIFAILVIHIQSTFLLSFLKERLQSDLMKILPWHLDCLKKTFINWAALLSIPLLIPAGFYAQYYFGNTFILYLFLILLIFYLTLIVKVRKHLDSINETSSVSEIDELIMYGVSVLFIFSGKFTIALFVSYLSFFLLSLLKGDLFKLLLPKG